MEDLDRIKPQFVDSWYLGGDQNNPEKNAKVSLHPQCVQCAAELTGSRCQWTLNLWRLLVLKFGSHEIELGDRHIEITKKEGVIGTMLQMPRLQQEERFAMPLADIKCASFIWLPSDLSIPC